MHPSTSITIRGIEYFGFSLTRGSQEKEKTAVTLWLLNGTVSELLDHKIFANYILMDEQDHRRYPNDSSLLFVDLKKLSTINSKAGELAAVLVGATQDPKQPEVKQILDDIKCSFDAFKDDMEVRKMMSRAEQLRADGKAEGINEGIKIGKDEGIKIGEAKGRLEGQLEAAKNLLEANMSPHEVAKHLKLDLNEVIKLA
jgi:hypothetical protein